MSRLLKISVENFMSVEKAEVTFDESNIVTLCGYNNSGKSAVTEAVEVVFYDSYAKEQVGYIKDGASYFEVALTFDDGVCITKRKNLDGTGIWRLEKDGECLYTNQLESGIASVSGVPEPIGKYLGVVSDEYTGELLNVRRNKDRLLLVKTTGGDNYKILNSVLKSELLAETSKRLNADKNKLQSDCCNKQNTIHTLEIERDSLNCAEPYILETLAGVLGNVVEGSNRQGAVEGVKQVKGKLEEYEDWGELPLVDSDRLVEVQGINTLMVAKSVPVYDECFAVNDEQLRSILGVQQALEGYKAADKEIPPEVEGVVADRLAGVLALNNLLNEYMTVNEKLGAVEQEIQGVQQTLGEYADKYNFKICGNCGTVVL